MTIEQILHRRGLLKALVARGHRLVGPCPVHGGDNPGAFVVDRRRNLWRCFTGCAGGGDVVDLVRRLDACGYAEVAHTLARLVDDATPLRGPMCSAARPFRPYARQLRLDPHHPFLVSRGVLPMTAARWEVGAWHGHGMLADCIGVRLHDPRGRPWGYAGRRLDPQRRGKWVLPAALPKSELLYGIHRLPPTPSLVLVEGPWEVLRLSQLRVPAVALLGTSLSASQSQLLEPYRRILVLLDGDDAGREGTRQIVQRLPQARQLSIGTGRDPADLNDHELRHLLSS